MTTTTASQHHLRRVFIENFSAADIAEPLASYNGTITLEVFAPEREHLLLSRDLVRKWWEGT